MFEIRQPGASGFIGIRVHNLSNQDDNLWEFLVGFILQKRSKRIVNTLQERDAWYYEPVSVGNNSQLIESEHKVEANASRIPCKAASGLCLRLRPPSSPRDLSTFRHIKEQLKSKHPYAARREWAKYLVSPKTWVHDISGSILMIRRWMFNHTTFSTSGSARLISSCHASQ